MGLEPLPQEAGGEGRAARTPAEKGVAGEGWVGGGIPLGGGGVGEPGTGIINSPLSQKEQR